MSIFYCHECDFHRDADKEGCHEHEGNLVCTDCHEGLTECDHLYQFIKDTDESGDCSFYLCRLCDKEESTENMTRQLNGGW